MFTATKKLIWLTAGLILAGGISVLGAQEIQQLNLTTKLANPIQKIQKIMFVVPIGTGSTWKTTGQVEVSARENKVTVNGSLITNVQSGNKVSGTSLKNSSLLGGVDNEFPSNVTGSAIVGGKNNEIKSDTATVLGGDGNTINPNSVRSTIIWGKDNTISAGNSTSIGGSGNTIQGTNSIILGGEGNIVSKANALAGGKGTTVSGEYTFAWSDGQRDASFSVSSGHTFAVNAKSGVAVGTDTPNAIAALTVSGDLRIQHYTSDTNLCNTTTIGTTKSITTGNQLCACFCDGKGWQAVLDTPQCVNACKDPRNDLKTICDYTDLWKAGSGGDYKHKFEPAWTGELLTGMIGCESGFVIPQFSYFYKTGTNNGTLNGLWTSSFYRTCVQPDRAGKETCQVSYACHNIPNQINLSKGAVVCPYSGTNTNDIKKDDIGLRQNVATTLIGSGGRQCNPNFSPTDKLDNGDGKINSINRTGQNLKCTNSSPDYDYDQSQKCQFYCPNGWHKETSSTGQQKCVENSCGAQQQTKTEKRQDSNKEITYNVVCINHGTNKDISTKADIANGGEVTYTKNYGCTTGNMLSGDVSYKYKIDYCDVGYHPVPGKTSNLSTYTGSYKCQENQYIVRYHKDFTATDTYEEQKGTVASNTAPTVISNTHAPAYNTSFTLKNSFSSSRAGYTLMGWSTSQQKLRNVAKQSASNYSPIPYWSAKEGSRQLNLWATATWNFTTDKIFPNYHVSDFAIFNLYAVWKRNSYTITFDPNGGKLSANAGVCNGDNSRYQRVIDESARQSTRNADTTLFLVMGTPASNEDEPTPAPTSSSQSKTKTACVDGLWKPTATDTFLYTGSTIAFTNGLIELTVDWKFGMTEFNGNEISKETLYSGTITLTGGTVYNGVMKFSATVSKNIVYSGFITLYPPRSVCGQISWKAKLLSSSTCNYFGEPSSCKAASCSWTATSISGNTGLVVYDELYSNTVAALLNNKPTRDGYEFLWWYTNATNGTKITSSTVANITAGNHTLFAHWLDLPSYPMSVMEGWARGKCKKDLSPNCWSGQNCRRLMKMEDFAGCWLYNFHRVLWTRTISMNLKQDSTCMRPSSSAWYNFNMQWWFQWSDVWQIFIGAIFWGLPWAIWLPIIRWWGDNNYTMYFKLGEVKNGQCVSYGNEKVYKMWLGGERTHPLIVGTYTKLY